MKNASSKIEALSPDLDSVRRFRDKFQDSHRNRHTSEILFGGGCKQYKEKLGIEGRGGDRRSKVRGLPLKSEGVAWSDGCRREFGLSRVTINRKIAKYDKALECAEDMHPSISQILKKPSAAVTDEDFEMLAACVDKLVDKMTAVALRIELGIEIEDDDEDDQGGGTASGPGDFQENLEQEALIFFASLPRKIAAMRKAIAPFRDYGKYQLFLHKLPLDDGRDGKPSLMGIKEGLEAILKEGISDVLSDLSEAIEAKCTGKAPKPSRPKSPTRRRK